MPRISKVVFSLAAIVTFAALIGWWATGGDYYTKFEVVEQVEKEIDPDDPLTAAGFYDGASQTETVTRKEFRLGLLPTPRGLLDKHVVSVVSLVLPCWVIAAGLAWWTRRQRKLASQAV